MTRVVLWWWLLDDDACSGTSGGGRALHRPQQAHAGGSTGRYRPPHTTHPPTHNWLIRWLLSLPLLCVCLWWRWLVQHLSSAGVSVRGYDCLSSYLTSPGSLPADEAVLVDPNLVSANIVNLLQPAVGR